ncbi:MAG: hypothetical protein JOZ22_21235, partial [Acidobacteriia bacterium]|nr:hypothetical protein [Terriglobia bacterium]
NNFHPQFVNQWNLNIQHQIGQDWLFTANYLGTTTIHLASEESVDPAVFLGLGPCTIPGPAGPLNYSTCSTTANQNQRRVLFLQNPALGQYFGGIGQLDDGGTSSYEGVYFSAQKRLSHGLTVLANYTWSHCISDPWAQNPTAAAVAIPGARRQWRANCIGQDLRQLFTTSIVATTPRFADRTLRILASNWQVAPIMTIKSAQEFSMLAGPDRALSTVPGQPASLVNPSGIYPVNQGINNWINPAAFAEPALGTYGNLGLNNLKGPGVFQLNMALSRTFPIKEHRSIQLRAEAFNLPNHLNPFTPGILPINTTLFGGQTTLNASAPGKITSDISGNNGLQLGDYRVIQMAMKFVF